MNATAPYRPDNSSSTSQVARETAVQAPSADFILRQMGLLRAQTDLVLGNVHHRETLEALFAGRDASLTMVAAPGAPLNFKWNSRDPLPAGIGSLTRVLAKVAPWQSAVMLAALLSCSADASVKCEIAAACVTAWETADLLPPCQFLGNFQNAAFQRQLRSLLAQTDIPTKVKCTWKPLLEYSVADAQDVLARVPQPGHSSAEPPKQLLLTLFFEALIYSDKNAMDKALAHFCKWPVKEMSEAHKLCCRERVKYLDLKSSGQPAGGAALIQDLMRTSTVSSCCLTVQELNEKGPQLMAAAVEEGNVEQMKALLQGPGRFLLNVPLPPMKWTALALAASLGKNKMVEFILAYESETSQVKLDCNARCPVASSQKQTATSDLQGSTSGATPLFLAAKHGHLEVVRLLLGDDRVNVNASNAHRLSPCMVALDNGNMSVAKLILAHPFMDVNREGPRQQTLLHRAARQGSMEVLELLLLDRRMDASKQDVYGRTPLHSAASNAGCPKAVGLILDHRTDQAVMLANVTDIWGDKPLTAAVESRNNLNEVIEPLRKLTSVTPVQAPEPCSIDYSKGLLIVGSDLSSVPIHTFKEIAKSEGIELETFGDGVTNLSWKDFQKLPVASGAFAIVHCHGRWDEARQQHMMTFGDGEEVPTRVVIRMLCQKGVARIVIFSCENGKGVMGIAGCINIDPHWPKPVHPNLKITFVGGNEPTLNALDDYDSQNLLKEFGSFQRQEGEKKEGLMESLTVSSTNTLAWEQEFGAAVLTQNGPSKIGDQPEITDEQRKSMLGNLLLKRAERAHLPDAAPATPVTTTTTTGSATTTTTATGITVETRRMQKLREILAQPEVDVNYEGTTGVSAIYLAASNGSPEVVKLLLEREDIEINKADKAGFIPLRIAASNGHAGVVGLLLGNKGVDLNKVGGDGFTPLRVAASNGHAGVVGLLLGNKGVDLNKAGRDGFTPLRVAVHNGHAEVVKLLLDKTNADINLGSANGATLLWAAASQGHAEVVKLLLDKEGVDINKANKDRVTPLRIAMSKGHDEVVNLLLEKNASVDCLSISPVEAAGRMGFTEIEKEDDSEDAEKLPKESNGVCLTM